MSIRSIFTPDYGRYVVPQGRVPWPRRWRDPPGIIQGAAPPLAHTLRLMRHRRTGGRDHVAHCPCGGIVLSLLGTLAFGIPLFIWLTWRRAPAPQAGFVAWWPKV